MVSIVNSDTKICLYIESSRHNVQLDFSIMQLSKYETCSFFGPNLPSVIRALRRFISKVDPAGLRAAIVLGNSAEAKTWDLARKLVTQTEFGEVIFGVTLADQVQQFSTNYLPTIKGEGETLGFVLPVAQAIGSLLQTSDFENIYSGQSPIFGREEELGDFREKFQNSRQVTVTGMAGVGKTRFILEYAKQYELDFLDGIIYCDLTTITNQAAAKKAVFEQIEKSKLNDLEEAEFLLILDNINPSFKDAAKFVQEMYNHLPKSSLICVNSCPLRMDSESIYRLQPLKWDPDCQRKFFLDSLLRQGRSLVIGETDQLVEELCRRCHGLPMAIVLSSQLARGMPIARLLERLNMELFGHPADESPLRRSMLRQLKTISEADVRILEKLCICGGSFSLRLVGYLVGDEVSAEGEGNVVVSRLVDANFINFSGGKLLINDLLRTKLINRVKRAGRIEILKEQVGKLADKVLQDFHFYMTSVDQAEAFRRLELDFEVIENAYYWRVSRKEHFKAAAEMALGIMIYFIYRGVYARPLEEFLKLLEQASEQNDKRLEAKIKHGTGRLLRAVGHYNAAIQLFRDARDISNSCGDLTGREMALRNMAICEQSIGQFDESEAHFKEAIMLQRQGGRTYGLAVTLNEYAGLLIRRGQKTRGAEMIFESMEIWNQLDLDWGKAWTLVELSWLSLLNQDVTKAEQFINQAHEISKRMKHASLKANVLLVRSRIRAEEYQYGFAEKHAKRSLIISRRTDEFMDLLLALRQLTQIYVLRENYSALDSVMEELCAVHARTGSSDFYVWPAYAGAVRAASKGQHEVALTLFGFATQPIKLYRNGMDFTMDEDDPRFKMSRAKLGEERSRALIAGGRTIPPDVLIKALPLDPTILLQYVDGLVDIPAPPTVKFSMREMEVLLAMSLAKSNQEIADELIISVGTVKRHVFNIMQKLDAKNRVDVLQKARTAGLF